MLPPLPGPGALRALGNDQGAGLDPALDNGLPGRAAAELNPALLHFVIGADHEHERSGLVDLHSGLRDDDRLQQVPRPSTVMPTNCPSESTRSGLGTSACTSAVSVARSVCTSTKLIRPAWA